MKFSRPAAVLGAAVVLVGGVTVAVHAATASTDSTRLCIQKNASTGSVYAPGDGVATCQKGFKLVELASADAVDALQTQVDGLQSQVAAAQTQADKTKTASWHGTAQASGDTSINFSVGDWSVWARCRADGTVANQFLDLVGAAHNNGEIYELTSTPDNADVGTGQILGPVAFLGYAADTQTVQLASISGPDEGLTITASRTRSGNDCRMTVTASAS